MNEMLTIVRLAISPTEEPEQTDNLASELKQSLNRAVRRRSKASRVKTRGEKGRSTLEFEAGAAVRRLLEFREIKSA